MSADDLPKHDTGAIDTARSRSVSYRGIQILLPIAAGAAVYYEEMKAAPELARAVLFGVTTLAFTVLFEIAVGRADGNYRTRILSILRRPRPSMPVLLSVSVVVLALQVSSESGIAMLVAGACLGAWAVLLDSEGN